MSDGKEKSPNGTMILVLGILSLIVCAPLGIVAWIMGQKERKLYPHDDMVTVGWILGIVGTCLLILGVIVLIVYGVIIGFVLTNAGSF